MKTNNKKGFIIPLLIGIIAILIIGGGVYIYTNKKVEAPVVQNQQNQNQQQTSTQNPSVTNNKSLVLKVNGPQELVLNQLGTWTVNAYSPNDKGEGSTLTYSEKWGDSNTIYTQNPPFTHAYSQFGTYTLVFTAKDSTGAQTTASTSVRVMNTTSPGLNATSNWKTYTSTQYGFSFQYPANAKIYDDCCQGSMIADLSVYYPSSSSDAANGVELNKVVGLQLRSDYNGSTNTSAGQNNPNVKMITKGNLAMNIWVSDAGYKDIFKIVSSSFKFTSTSTQPSITVLSPNGGETYKKGDTVDIKWQAKNINSTLEINLLKPDGTLVYNLESLVSVNRLQSNWWIPTDKGPGGRRIDAGQYIIRVSPSAAQSYPAPMDDSDYPFTVTN